MSGIFISYRRSDSQDVAGRIFDRLVQRFSRRQVFKDVDSIPLSVQFPVAIREALDRSAVMLVLLGPTWLSCKDSEGKRRLDDPLDPVRIEVETALEVGVPIVPVTVSNAVLPSQDALPHALKPIATRQGQPVRPDPDFHRDMNSLIHRLSPLLNLDTGEIAKSVDRSLLLTLLDLSQGWYNQVVQTIAELKATDDKVERDRIDFIYVKTREFMPRILSIRHLLNPPEFARLAENLDNFLNLLTWFTDGRRHCYESHILMTALLAGGLTDTPVRPFSYHHVITLPKLERLETALQGVSDEVIRLLDRANTSNANA